MLVNMKYLSERFGYSRHKISCVIDRSEFAKFRKGGLKAMFLELNEESEKLLIKLLGKRRKAYDNSGGKGL